MKTTSGAVTENPLAGGTADVVILGSGAAGLAAALAASVAGLSVVILEKSDRIGGTSAMSGAGTWIPANHHQQARGIADSADAAMAYIAAVLPEDWREEEMPRWRAFVEHAPEMLRFVEEHTPARFEILSEPDPVLEAPGACRYGRMLSTLPLRRKLAGPYAGLLRRSTQPHSLTYEEMIHANFVHRPLSAYRRNGARILARRMAGEATQGTALITGLLRGCLDHGCVVLPSARAMELLMRETGDGGVAGVSYEQGGVRHVLHARRGVVIATGGFEWDADMYAAHFPPRRDLVCSPTTNSGDGQRMAARAGAALGRMDQMNVAGALPTRYEGAVHGMPLRFQADRHAIVVDGTGRRFGNEFDFNFGERLLDRDADGNYLHLPAWVIADARILRHTPILRLYARNQPGWLRKAPTLAALAADIDVPADALAQTVARYNGFAENGVDGDFGRGSFGYDRLVAGRDGAMRALDRAPFLAMPFNISLMGTKGGPMTDARARVLRPDGTVLPGLFAAGNAMANPFGTRAVGTGTTIGPALTWGYIAGRELAQG